MRDTGKFGLYAISLATVSFCHKKNPIIKHLIENDNDKMVEVVHKKLSLLRVCISRNAV